MQDSFNIQDYSKQLEQICDICPEFRKKKCDDHTRLCYHKKVLFNLAKKEFKKKTKEKKNLNQSK